jgi:hypothetical protein
MTKRSKTKPSQRPDWAVRDWEQQRRVPRGPARTLLRIIEREPETARRALAGNM